MSKKALIITYYWPPAGGPGVQRWLKFVKYLPEYAIKPIVFIPENPSYPILDTSLEEEVSKELTIIKFPIKEPYRWAALLSKKESNTLSKGVILDRNKQSLLQRLLLFVRGNFFVPDARKAWVKPAVKFLLEYVKSEGIDTIITTGPPHSVHLIGFQLKQQLPVKWIADFRDPWTSIGYHKELKLTRSSQKKHKFLEAQVLNSSDEIVVTSFKTKEEFQSITSKPITIITNGYDDVDTTDFKKDKKFTLSHIGSLLSQRNPKNLWRVLGDLVHENPNFSKDLQLNFVGFISDNVLNTIKDFNLSNYVNNLGYVSHKEAIAYQKKSQVLLLLEIDSKDTKSIIPGKLFEYMISKRPIIAVGPEDSDMEKIILETHTGQFFNYSDYNKLKAGILDYYIAYKNNQLQSHPIGLEKYHRKSLTKALSDLI